MADLNEFESAGEPQVATDEDPAAAFFAREQDQLAELEGDSLGGDTSQPPAEDGFDPFGGEAAPAESTEDAFGGGAQEPQTGSGDFLDGFVSEPATNMATDPLSGDGDMFNQPIGISGGDFGESDELTGSGDFLDGFVSEPATNMATDPLSGDGDMFNQPIGISGGDFGESDELTNGPTDSYSAISQVDRQRAEPEKIRVWREEQTKMLEKKDEEEEKKREEWRNQAKKELDDWYKHNAEQVTKTRENNRAAEAAFVKERDEKTSGHNWEKICRLCEFNPKNSKNMKDISRLRSILLQLKQTPLER